MLEWTYTLANAKAIRAHATTNEEKAAPVTVELYRRFYHNGKEDDCLYLGVKVTILPAPSIKYGDVDSYMKKGTAANGASIVELSTLAVANPANETVEYFQGKVANYYPNGKITADYLGTTGANYPELSKIITDATFEFAPEQMSGLSVSADGLSLEDKDGNVIATITADGTVAYSNDDAALELLNSKNGVYANVLINSEYCNETPKKAPYLSFFEQANNVLQISFRQPLTLTGAANMDVTPNALQPTKKALPNFFSLKDYYGASLYTISGGKAVASMATPVTGASKNVFNWYEINSVEFDLSKVSVRGVDITLEGDNVVNNEGVYTLAVKDKTLTVEDLNKVNVVCAYNSEVLQSDVTITVPVSVTYYWGTLETTATIKVKKADK